MPGPIPALGGLGVVVSIGKLAPGQARYYLDHAGGSLSRASAVSSGVEDYYVGGPQAAGRWIGRSAPSLGLTGVVKADELRAVLEGHDPLSGEALRRRGRVPGFDVTFSAPKSVSVLFGVGDDHVRAAVERAHDAAVLEAFAYLERHGAYGRRGTNGTERLEGAGLVAGRFVHRTSRAGDPHLHTHVLVANLVRCDDGRWSALNGRLLYAHAKTASFLYQAALRAAITRELRVAWGPVRKGIAEVDGISERVRRGFSRRRAEIDAELRRLGARGPRAAQVAALETRRAKDYRVRPDALRGEWQERAARLGLPAAAIRRLVDRPFRQQGPAVTVERIFAQLSSREGLTDTRSTFTRREVVRELCERLPVGTPTSAIEGAADSFLASEHVVPLLERGGTESLTARDGRLFPAGEELRYSTPELIAVEQRLIDRSLELKTGCRGVVPAVHVERALSEDSFLTAEQQALVRHLTLAGGGVAVVVGRAGTGKTTALRTARAAWERAGVPVLGCAVARRAAHELEAGSGIPSTSVAALLHSLEAAQVELPPGAVLVVDEAGMLGTRDAAQLFRHVDTVHGKLVLVGDPKQLQSIAAGGLLAGLAVRIGAIELTENRRQHEAWERDALAQLRAGDAEPAVAAYRAHGRITLARDPEDARRRLVAEWHAIGESDGTVMIAHYRRDVAELNIRARAVLRDRGQLGLEELLVEGAPFAVGDRVVVRLNDRSVGVSNGDRGVITGVDMSAGSLTVRIANRDTLLPAEYLCRMSRSGDPVLQHGYAMTAYVAQGLTCRTALVLAHDGADQGWTYTAMSRGTDRNQLYVAREPTSERLEYAPRPAAVDPELRLTAVLGRSQPQTLASDVLRAARRHDELARVSERRAARAADRELGRDR